MLCVSDDEDEDVHVHVHNLNSEMSRRVNVYWYVDSKCFRQFGNCLDFSSSQVCLSHRLQQKAFHLCAGFEFGAIRFGSPVPLYPRLCEQETKNYISLKKSI